MDEAPRSTTSQRIAYVHRRISRLLMGAGALVAGAHFVAAVVGGLFAERALADVIGSLFGATAALATLTALVGLAVRELPRASAGTVARDETERLFVKYTGRRFGARDLRLPAVRSGCLVPAGAAMRAELDLENGDQLQVDAPDLPSAIDVLRVAGVDAAQQRARFRVDSSMARAFAYVLAASLIAAISWPLGKALIQGAQIVGAGLWLVMIGAVTWLGASFIAMPEITVGTDGVAYRRGPFRRFIPLSDIKEVRSSDVTLYIHLRSGRIEKLRSLTGADPGRAYSLELRVREVLAAARGEHTSAQLELLERKGRSVADWTSAVAGLARAGSSYRAASLSAEDLDAIVTSPDVTPERRIGAALALSNAGLPSAGERIRVAAAQCASPRLRIALERVGEGDVDHEAIREALAETEAAEARAADPKARVG